jgi:acyl carrier protein
VDETDAQQPQPLRRPDTPGAGPPRAGEIRDWLVAHLARLVKCPPGKIDVTTSFDRLGLDSATAVGVTLDLEDWLGRPVEPAIFYDYPTIRQLADELARAGDDRTPGMDAPDGSGGS